MIFKKDEADETQLEDAEAAPPGRGSEARPHKGGGEADGGER